MIDKELELIYKTVRNEARVLNNDVLKVDSFLNHRLDVQVLNAIGKSFHRIFGNLHVDLILTAEVSGIAIATVAAQYFDVPVVFARKYQSKNLDSDTWEGQAYSYTKQQNYQLRVAKRFLTPDHRVLILDDFLANGEAIKGMKQIIDQSGAYLAGTGVVIEKVFQSGGDELAKKGVLVKSLVRVMSLSNGHILLDDSFSTE